MTASTLSTMIDYCCPQKPTTLTNKNIDVMYICAVHYSLV